MNNLIWLQMILLFVGIVFIIIALLKPKENLIFEEKIEKVLDDFMGQMDLENQEILKKIKESKNETPHILLDKLSALENRITLMENRKLADENNSTLTPSNPKYNEVIKRFDRGESIDHIAKELQIGHAEIKLILELAKKGLKYV